MPLRASSFSLTLPHGVPKLTSELAPAHQSFAFALKHKPDAIHTYSAPSVPAPRQAPRTAPWTAGTTDGRHRHTRASGRTPGQTPPPPPPHLVSPHFLPPHPTVPCPSHCTPGCCSPSAQALMPPHIYPGRPLTAGADSVPKTQLARHGPSGSSLDPELPPASPRPSCALHSQTALSVCRPCSSFSSPTLKSWKTSSC